MKYSIEEKLELYEMIFTIIGEFAKKGIPIVIQKPHGTLPIFMDSISKMIDMDGAHVQIGFKDTGDFNHLKIEPDYCMLCIPYQENLGQLAFCFIHEYGHLLTGFIADRPESEKKGLEASLKWMKRNLSKGLCKKIVLEMRYFYTSEVAYFPFYERLIQEYDSK